MNPCDECLIDDKLFECCGRFPESGDTTNFPNNENRTLYACPNLRTNGKCGIYEKRPYVCQAHHCNLYDTMDSVGNGLQDLKAQWEGWHENNIKM